jgi:hypothetical protein
MPLVRSPLPLAAAALLLATPLLAQSLGEVAAREKERREKKPSPSPAPAFTDDDLLRRHPPEPPKASPSPGVKTSTPKAKATPAPAPTPEAPATPDPEAAMRPQLEAMWKARAKAAREAVAKAEARVKELESRLGGLRSDTSPTGLLDPYRQQTREAEAGRARDELQQAQQQLALARQALDDLEDEARRQRIPPGWLRES